MFFARLSGVPDPAARIGTALAAMDFTGHGQERMSTFSKGMRQRAGLAQAIVNEPAVLFLDEPTSGLDPQGVAQLRQIIIGLNQDLGMTVFMNTHLLAEVTRTCTSIGILSRPADLPGLRGKTYPRVMPPALGDPFAEQRGLAEARGGTNERQLPARTRLPVQTLEQPRPGNKLRTRRGNIELRNQHRRRHAPSIGGWDTASGSRERTEELGRITNQLVPSCDLRPAPGRDSRQARRPYGKTSTFSPGST
jgi:hypothetical protein